MTRAHFVAMFVHFCTYSSMFRHYGFALTAPTRRPAFDAIRGSRSMAAGTARTYRRTFAAEAALSSDDIEETTTSEELLHPNDFGEIPYPKALSPSSIMEFKKCPQSFLFQYLYGLKQPTSLAMAKGSMCHGALEKVFDLEPEDRTLEHLQNLFRVEWAQNRKTDTYKILFERESPDPTNTVWDFEAEREWGKEGLHLLENYYKFEDPKRVLRPNPMRREIWLRADLPVDPFEGSTAKQSEHSADVPLGPTFHVRGIVDRLDMVRLKNTSERKVALRVVDYKTGKAPNLKYSQAVNDRIMNDNFFQLKIYALLLHQQGAQKPLSLQNKMDLRILRLLYLTSVPGKAMAIDMDLGETSEERSEVLHDVHKELSEIWNKIFELVSLQDPKAFVGCDPSDSSYCYCHKCRERFVPGTVWSPPKS